MSDRLGEQCEHGSLKRQCRVCELEADVARLAQENERLVGELAQARAEERERICRLWYDLAPIRLDDAMWLMLDADRPAWITDLDELDRRAQDAKLAAAIRRRDTGGSHAD